MNRPLSLTGNVVAGAVAFLLYLGIALYFTATRFQGALVGAIIVGVIVFAIALSATRMIGSVDDHHDAD